MMAAKGSTSDAIENVESDARQAGVQSEKDRIDMTRRILFKLDTRCVQDSSSPLTISALPLARH
jgi:hypothetical protein